MVTELGYSSVGAVKYAIENWNNSDLDVFKDNCTNFVSDSLSYGGGMPQKEDWWLPRHFDSDGWSDGTAGNSDPFPPGLSHGGIVKHGRRAVPEDRHSRS